MCLLIAEDASPLILCLLQSLRELQERVDNVVLASAGSLGGSAISNSCIVAFCPNLFVHKECCALRALKEKHLTHKLT